jgi:ABC-2 type transport system permease protein
MTRLRSMLVKETLQLRRDPRLLGLLLIAPVLQLLVLGFAANTDVREIDLAVRDRCGTPQSREYVRGLAASGCFRVTALSGPESADASRLVSGAASMVLTIPPDFSRKLLAGHPAAVQVLVDGADGNVGIQGLNRLRGATRLFSERLRRGGAPPPAAGAAGVAGTVLPAVRVWYNPDLDSRRFLLPGLMGLLLMVTTMIVTSMALVKEREEGTMEQIIVTPLRRSEVLAGKLLPFVVVGFAGVTMALPVIVWLFGVPLRGSLGTLYLATGLFLLNTLGLGLLISTLVRTQQQAMLVAAFFVMLPFVLLSGFVFPVENMPAPIRVFAEVIPLRFFLRIVRGLFLKGIGLADLWPDALALLAWGAGLLGLALLNFRKRLD